MLNRSRLPFSLLFVLAAAAPAMAQTAPAAPQASKASGTLEQFYKIRAPGSADLLADGSMLVRDWPDGIFQLYLVTPKAGSYKPGEATFTKLTSYPDGLASYSLSPDRTHAVLAYGSGGNENFQLDLISITKDTASGKTTPVSVASNPKVQHAVNHWLPDGSGFYFSANDTSPEDFYLYRYDVKTGTKTKVLGKPGSWSVGDCTPDGARLLVEKFNSASDSQVFELTVATGELRELTVKDQEPSASCGIVGYLPDFRTALITSDCQAGIKRLFPVDVTNGTHGPAVETVPDAELDAAAINNSRTLLAVVTNEDGFGQLRVFNTATFQPVKLPELERGVVTLSSFRDGRIVANLSNARTPGLSYMIDVATKGKLAWTQLTYADTQGIDLGAFPLPTLVRYTAADGVGIPAFLWLPPGASADKPTARPFVVNYHGGPEGQSRPVFSVNIQYLLTHGYGVIQPNVRGSTGYGRSFQMMDDYKNRWKSVQDGVDAAEWLVANGHAKPGKIASYGGSYGGYMSVATVVEDQLRVDAGKRKERLFGCAIDVVGIVNLKSFLEKTSGYRRKLREAEYGPLSDPAFLESVSSINRVDKINIPVFIAHGKNDPRVPLFEAQQLFDALQKRSQKPEMLVFDDEGHGFVKLPNRLKFGTQMVDFLDRTIAK